jgi:lantibiotic leader peptide-processing serine protease
LHTHAVRRALLFIAAAALTLAFAGAASAARYIVLYKAQGVPADGGAAVRAAGGTVVASYSQIGVIIAESTSPTFRGALMKDSRVDGVASTAGLGVQIKDQADSSSPGDLPNAPATDSAEPLFGLQWDMRQIHTPEAHAITGGSRAVLAGDLDTGLDFTHPDLSPHYDAANSTNCESGAPAPLLPGNDQAGHGTHTAGTIAAAANGIGIVGVAPNVRIAGVKAANDDGFFFPEMVVCGFVWAGTHHFDVTNNSYFADPWLFNCKNDPEQHAIWKAEQRAIRFAMQQGVTVVAAAGNFSDDLAHPTQDVISPDTGPGETRAIRNNCVVIPVEIPGVIGVSATGVERRKSYYSNYGSGVIEVAAPGGDAFQIDPAQGAVNGRVLSTWPSYLPCLRRVTDPAVPTAVYCYLQGTSMAAPHVTGLAALVISRFGDSNSPQNGHMSPGAVASRIQQTADPTPCPDDFAPYEPFPSVSNGAPQTCTGGLGNNSWYGKGIVNALSAVS